jgi:hypothetical protein
LIAALLITETEGFLSFTAAERPGMATAQARLTADFRTDPAWGGQRHDVRSPLSLVASKPA